MFLMIGTLGILMSHVKIVVVQLPEWASPIAQDSSWLYHSDTGGHTTIAFEFKLHPYNRSCFSTHPLKRHPNQFWPSVTAAFHFHVESILPLTGF